MAQKITTGDIFYWKLESHPLFIFGRILFDVDRQLKNSTIDRKSYLSSYTGCHLIEIYKGIYPSGVLPDNPEVLIPRAFVFRLDLKGNSLEWGKAGHKEVDITRVEFPEVVGNAYNEVRLMRGELYFSTDLKDAVQYPGVLPGAEFPVVMLAAALSLQGRQDLITGEYYPEAWPTWIYITTLRSGKRSTTI